MHPSNPFPDFESTVDAMFPESDEATHNFFPDYEPTLAECLSETGSETDPAHRD
jgi:hypothetical protein